jgi:pyrroloquinoline quinone biosynthesis protein D
MHRPLLVNHARYRWDKLRDEHQLVFPEGILVLNETGAAIVRLCDGRSVPELVAAVAEQFDEQFPHADLGRDVHAFLERLARKGLLRDAIGS